MPSLVGAATAAYSAALVAAPRILIGPCGLEDSPDTRTLARALGVRDAAIGLAMIAVPAGRATRGKIVGFAAAWGALCLIAGVLDERAGR
ncbi:MAG: hypothetical protein JWP68_3168 [Modestobacter sp.]|nr:hypothetical protein [Modestobacter sp.]MCW2575148.1 hypothetical protein [Modestobacter sp.]